MTLTSRDIIQRGYRKLGVLASGQPATAEEMADGLTALNGLLRALYGTVIGPRLSPQPMTGNQQAENGGLYQASLSSASRLTAPSNPRSGSRFGITDSGGNFATFNATVMHNGRLLEGAAADIVFNVNGSHRVWFYDADAGSWIAETDLASPDVSPGYPDRLVDFLPDMFAVFVGAEFEESAVSQDVASLASQGLQAFARNYGRRGRNQLDPPAGFTLAGQGQG